MAGVQQVPPHGQRPVIPAGFRLTWVFPSEPGWAPSHGWLHSTGPLRPEPPSSEFASTHRTGPGAGSLSTPAPGKGHVTPRVSYVTVLEVDKPTHRGDQGQGIASSPMPVCKPVAMGRWQRELTPGGSSLRDGQISQEQFLRNLNQKKIICCHREPT